MTASATFDKAVDKLPVIGQYRKDKARQAAQDKWFTENSGHGYIEQDPTVWEWVKSVAPTRTGALHYVADTFPCTNWMFRYNLQWLLGDLVAGLTVGAVIIPQGMAYAKLAQLPVEYGLYTSFFGGLLYWIFGTSKDINIGPVAVASIVTGSILSDITHEFPDQSKPILAGSVALLAGGCVALIGFLRLGWLVDLISLPAVLGFISGSAITITIGQIPPLLGIRGINTREAPYKVLIHIFKKLGTTKLDAALGISALVALYLIKWGCTWVGKKRPQKAKVVFFLSTLRTVLIILVYILISYLVNRTHKETPSFRILGFIPRGFRNASPPHLNREVMSKIMGALPAAIVVLVVEHIAIGKSFGRINNYRINPNSEFIAIGIVNMVGAFVGAYAATGSFSRTAVNSKAGSRTPLAGVVTAALVVIALYTLTPMFYFVPQAALAAVIIHAIGDLVTPPSTLYEFWKIDPLDVFIFLIGLFTIIFVGIEQGVFAMIGMSLAIQLFHTFKASGRFLGRVSVQTYEHNKDSPKTGGPFEVDEMSSTRNVFLPLDREDGSNLHVELERPHPGIFIYRLTEGFNYLNASSSLDAMSKAIMEETRPTTVVAFTNRGDAPWNEVAPQSRNDEPNIPDRRPKLRAVILDFSSVNNVDVTSVQALMDTRNFLDRHAAPDAVQWHFACVNSRWAKRALVAACFGMPSIASGDGTPKQFKAVYSVAEQAGAVSITDDKAKSERWQSNMVEDVEMVDLASQEAKIGVSKATKSMASVYGVNRPYFHVDIQSALISAMTELDTLYEEDI